MTQVEMTNKALDVLNDFMQRTEANALGEVENSLLAVIAMNLAAIADESKKERK